MSQYDVLLIELGKRRTDLETAKVNKAKLLADFQATPDFKANDEVQRSAAARIDELEKSIRELGKADFEATGEKHPHEKVEIKIFQTFKIIDTARVLAWVKTNLADALVYDETKVKSYATKIGAVDGTEIVDEPRVQIASKL